MVTRAAHPTATLGPPDGVRRGVAEGAPPVAGPPDRRGATTMPRSRCCITIAGRLSRLGQSLNLNVRRVRHHRIAPLTTNNIAASPVTPMIVSPTSPVKR